MWFNRQVVTSARDRETFDAAVAKGSDLLKQGNLAEAQRSFRIALEHEPNNTRVLALLGLTYFRGNQFDEARPIYEQLVELSPSDASHRLNLGLVWLKLNEADRAIAALEASRALDPSQGRAISYLGLAYARAGRYAEAYRSFLRAGQNELASEIEINLTAAEREGIHVQLGRASSPAISRTPTPEPRTKPPSAPPKGRTPTPHPSGEFNVQLSHPEIVIERGSLQPSVPMVPVRSGASIPDPTPPLTQSQQFVFARPEPSAPQQVMEGVSMVSQAVAAAAPSTSAQTRERTKAGGTPPRPLSELATDELIRPDDAEDAFEIAATGALVIRVIDRVMTRLDGVHITGGDLAYEPATRRSRGSQTEERFDYGGTALHAVSGAGYLIAVPGDHTFSAVSLDDDILYLREDLVFAFETSLRWESGNVPGMRGKLPVVQFRGDGALAIRTKSPLVRVKLAPSGVVFIDAERLAGWIGRVIPRAVVPPSGGPMGAMCVECTGEGIVLVEPAPPAVAAPVAIAAPERARPPTPPPASIVETKAETAPAAVDPELDMSSVFEGDPPTPPTES